MILWKLEFNVYATLYNTHYLSHFLRLSLCLFQLLLSFWNDSIEFLLFALFIYFRRCRCLNFKLTLVLNGRPKCQRSLFRFLKDLFIYFFKGNLIIALLGPVFIFLGRRFIWIRKAHEKFITVLWCCIIDIFGPLFFDIFGVSISNI